MFIKQIQKIEEILESNARWFFIDIEETILKKNIYYQLINDTEYEKILVDLQKQSNTSLSDVLYLGKNYRRELTEPEIPYIINELKNAKKNPWALTSGYPSQLKKQELIRQKVFFNGILFTRGQNKGPYLKNFLKKLKNFNEFSHCCFVDNHKEKIIDVYQHFHRNFPNATIDLFQYEYVDHIEQDYRENFVKYWTEVIKQVENGAVNNVRKQIQSLKRSC